MDLPGSAIVYTPSGRLAGPVACLMQGLATLGISVLTNIDPKADTNRYGILHPFSRFESPNIHYMPNLAEIVLPDSPIIVDTSFIDGWALQPENRLVVAIDVGDLANHKDLSWSNLCFTAHVVHILDRKEDNRYPFPMGISQELYDFDISKYDKKDSDIILNNFQPSFNQQVRDALQLALIPALAEYFTVDRRIELSHEEYITALACSGGILTYGGAFISAMLKRNYWREKMQEGTLAVAAQFDFENLDISSIGIGRWDSYRFYEACALGCAPITLDFDYYGLVLPVNPTPWVHYIPITFHKIESTVAELYNRCQDNPAYLKEVGANARDWVRFNYSPVAIAKYVLDIIARQRP